MTSQVTHQLYEHCEAEQQRLVRRRQVDAAIERNEKDEFDEQRRVDDRISDASCDARHWANGHCRLQRVHDGRGATKQKADDQHLAEEEMSPTRILMSPAWTYNLWDEVNLEDDQNDGETSGRY